VPSVDLIVIPNTWVAVFSLSRRREERGKEKEGGRGGGYVVLRQSIVMHGS